jgi:hypothetical protein
VCRLAFKAGLRVNKFFKHLVEVVTALFNRLLVPCAAI